MLGAGFAEEELRPLGNLDARVPAQHGRVLADQVLVDVQRAVVALLTNAAWVRASTWWR